MGKCERCGKIEIPKEGLILRLPFGLCDDCRKQFEPLREQLRLAFIHHYMHPEKKTIYVHDESKRYNNKSKLKYKENKKCLGKS